MGFDAKGMDGVPEDCVVSVPGKVDLSFAQEGRYWDPP